MARRYRSLMVPLEIARWRLGTLWFLGAAAIFAILAVQSMFNVYGERVPDVWGWALPNIVPTLSLMMGVFAAAALAEDNATDRMRVRRPFFWLAAGLSSFHLLSVAGVILIQPVLPSALAQGGGEYDPLRAFVVSNLWLGPLQGLVAAALGALFFSRSESKASVDLEPTPPRV